MRGWLVLLCGHKMLTGRRRRKRLSCPFHVYCAYADKAAASLAWLTDSSPTRRLAEG